MKAREYDKRTEKENIRAGNAIGGGAPADSESIMARIDKTGELLQAMLDELKRRGADEKLFAKAAEYLKLGIVAAKWSIEQ